MRRPLFLVGLLSVAACSPSLGGNFNTADASADAADVTSVLDAKQGVDVGPSVDVVPAVDGTPSVDVAPADDVAPVADVTPSVDVVPADDVAPSTDVVPTPDVPPVVDVVPVVDVPPAVDVPPRICGSDPDCADTDPCTTGERCDPATRICTARPLDGDGDMHGPRVCGGDDCDDGNPAVFGGAAETCNGRDDDCDGMVDDGATCGAGEVCRSGRCECDGARVRCGGVCLDVSTSNAHCGRCDNPCGVGSTCVAGACACTAGTLCGSQCVDTATNATHCGGCNRSCPSGERCTAGVCECPPGGVCGEQCAGLSVIDAARVGIRTGNVLRILGDNTAAWSAQNPGGVLASRSPIVNSAASCPRSTGQVIYRYTTTMGAALRVTTSNPGTRASLDTVLYASNTCAATINNACNDDDPDLAATRGLTSRLLIDSLPAGYTLYIVVGGYSPLTSGTFDRGAFELTITEEGTIPSGSTCRADSATGRCASGLMCALPVPGSETGTCRAAGTSVGATCRSASPQCDVGLTCGTTGAAVNVCTRDVGLGAACDDYNRCVGGNYCRPVTFGTTRGTCVAPGTALGAPCRATAPQCDSGLNCGVVASTGAMQCAFPSIANGACDPTRNVCPFGYHCVAPLEGIAGLCRADGTVFGSTCRASGTRCDGGLTCVNTPTGDQVCGTVSSAGGACSLLTACATGSSCSRFDPTDPFHGVCGATGVAGGDCRTSGTRCDGGAVCTTDTGAGRCIFRVGVGEACRWPTHYCSTGLTCVPNPGDTVNGVCRATGSVAGARCGTGNTCVAGLTCSPTPPGTCSAVTTGDCDPTAGTTVCPSGQACMASSVVRGRCGGLSAEVEPNDTPALVASRAVSAPTVVAGALPYNDVDCVAVRVPEGGNVVATVSDGNGRCPLVSGETAIELYDTDGLTIRLIGTRNGPGDCANIDGGRRTVFPAAGGLPAGTYTVCVHGVSTTAVPAPSMASYVFSVAASL